MFKQLLNKVRGKKSKDYPNRFLKFYHLNRKRLIKERRSAYAAKRKRGVCVRCSKKALKNLVFCSYHRDKQKEYNRIAKNNEP